MNRHRPVVMGAQGMVASGHWLASAAGLRVLAEGGNAFDAAVAAAAVVAVVKPNANSIGGHNLALLWHARQQQLYALDANGTAPAAAVPERYVGGIPAHGPLSVSVPGVVAGWEAILARFGTRTMADVLEAAAGYAERGFPVSQLLHDHTAAVARELADRPSTAAVYLPGGRPPATAELLRQPDLARTLRAIARQGAAGFYRGEVAARLGEAVAAAGGILSASDLESYQVKWLEPVRSSYRGVECWWQPPSSQGFVTGEELNIVEPHDLAAMAEVDRLHLMIEAKKLAFADRARYLCDPDFHAMPIEVLLSAEHAVRQRARVGSRAAAEVDALDLQPAGGETTYLCAADRQGNAVSFIQSIFSEYGSYLVAGDTGVLLNNRMYGFSAEPGHPNAVAPGKRPAMTLNACMLFRDGRPWILFGTPGADAQPQTNFQNVARWLDDGLDLQAGIEAPRWRHLAGRRVLLEDRFSPDTIAALRERGHDAQVVAGWYYDMGGAEAISMDPASGVMQAGADPRREGYAIGF